MSQIFCSVVPLSLGFEVASVGEKLAWNYQLHLAPTSNFFNLLAILIVNVSNRESTCPHVSQRWQCASLLFFDRGRLQLGKY